MIVLEIVEQRADIGMPIHDLPFFPEVVWLGFESRRIPRSPRGKDVGRRRYRRHNVDLNGDRTKLGVPLPAVC